jgi:uncharacterized repeat protein (TIGR03803 family)
MFKNLIFFSFSFLTITAYSQPELWGTTNNGGSIGSGTIFKLDTAGNNYSLEYDWQVLSDGKRPHCGVIQASNDKLYGVAFQDGSNFGGVLFEYDFNTGAYIKKHDFTDPTGSLPEGQLIQASNGKLYGLAGFGGLYNLGVLFEYDLTTSTYSNLVDFELSNLGGGPHGKLIEAPNGKLYGLNSHGGALGFGTLFEFDIITGIASTIIDLDSINSGFHPFGGLTMASNGMIYALSYSGGLTNKGLMFEFDYTNGSLIKHIDFLGASNGSYPYGDVIEATNGKLYGLTFEGGINGVGTLFEFDLSTNTFIKKVDFGGVTVGSNPKGTLMQSANGKLYGYTSLGGDFNKGIVFEYDIALDTVIKKLDFDGVNGLYNTGNSFVQICKSPTINISLSTNDTLCENTNIILNATGTNNLYTWNNGVTNNVSFLPALGSNTYIVSATNMCGTTIDSVQITSLPVYNIYHYDTICYGYNYTFTDGSIASNLQNDTIQMYNIVNPGVCDTTVTTSLHIVPLYNNLSENVNICFGDSYQFPDGFLEDNITSTLSHISSITTLSGSCDSIINTTITVTNISTLVSQNGITLTSDFPSATYQWIDCENGNSEIIGETNQFFTPSINGIYAVVVNFNNCSDTSLCFNINDVSIQENITTNYARAYPNPTSNQINLEFYKKSKNTTIKVNNLNGECIKEINNFNGSTLKISLQEFESGVYFIEIISEFDTYYFKIIKK